MTKCSLYKRARLTEDIRKTLLFTCKQLRWYRFSNILTAIRLLVRNSKIEQFESSKSFKAIDARETAV